MSPPRVLISGASVAGPALAYWLTRAGCTVTVVERSRVLRSEGQGIDIRDSGRTVIKQMGIFDLLRSKSSKEEGIRIVDGRNRDLAKFAVDLSGAGESFTCDIEILRGELAGVLFDVTKNDVEYIFGDMVQSLKESEDEVEVSFVNGTRDMTFDLVVAADGIGSKVRGMALGSENENIRRLNGYVSYFSLKKGDTDSMWSRVHWFKGGRNVSVRPDNMGRTRAFVCLTAYDDKDPRLARLEKASKEGVLAQKAVVQELFQDVDWESKRILKGMQESDDFYMQLVAQVRLKRWSSGRVTVVGDAGYAPSPFTGMGTSIAFIGAYVLAGEISRQKDNIPAALDSYERILRPYVESIQKLPPGIPWIVNPQSALGVKVLETFAWSAGLISSTGIVTLVTKLVGYLPFSLWPFGEEPFKLPEYEAFRQ
ncbi:MAG: hypothetical protein M1812_005626 [Candelaria pacifica]|nr:MAG: hypothetical protein M1812_005626 [Candelaria pacifica]